LNNAISDDLSDLETHMFCPRMIKFSMVTWGGFKVSATPPHHKGCATASQ